LCFILTIDREREANLQTAIHLQEKGEFENAQKFYKKSVDVSSAMVAEVIKVNIL
jgi:hypothetical protein